MEYLLSLIVGALAIYGASVLLNKLPVSNTHKRILVWARDNPKVQDGSIHRTFSELVEELSDDALTGNDVKLAIEASIAANQAPVGRTDNPSAREPLRQLGALLRDSWNHNLTNEEIRRSKSR